MKCRVCDHETPLQSVLNLGEMPLANSLLSRPDEEFKRYPLEMLHCPDCHLVQLSHIVPPSELFTDYAYLTSCSPPMVEHAKQLVDKVLSIRSLCASSLVMEIGSNDGYLLQHYLPHGIPVLGIDPSAQAAAEAEKRSVRTLREFFDSTMAMTLEKADVIHANNVLAHVPYLDDFVACLAHVLKDNGVLIIEVPYLCDLINKIAFDTIYHEHVYYFSLTALTNILSLSSLTICDVERIHTHGGSLRLWITKGGMPSAAVRGLLSQESFFIRAPGYYSDFAARVEKCKSSTRELIGDNLVAGFGAAAKATIFLNACGINSTQMVYVADDTPTKQGKFLPGTDIPIVPTSRWLEDQPRLTMVLCWNFANEVAHKYAKTYHGQFFTWYTPELVKGVSA